MVSPYRWDGIERPYIKEEVLSLRGSKKIEYTLAKDGANKLWELLHEKEAVFQHVFLMVSEGKIQLENDAFLEANFDTICVHSDTQNSVEILRYLREQLAYSKKTM